MLAQNKKAYYKLKELLTALNEEEINKCEAGSYFNLHYGKRVLKRGGASLYPNFAKHEICPVCPIATAVVKAGFKVLPITTEFNKHQVEAKQLERIYLEYSLTYDVVTVFTSVYDKAIHKGMNKQEAFSKAMDELDTRFGDE